MILLLTGLAAHAYDVDVTAISLTDGRQYYGRETTDGSTPETPVLAFEVDFDDTDILGATELTLDRVSFSWSGSRDGVGQLRVWRDANGDYAWDPATDTALDALTMPASGKIDWAPSAETLPENTKRAYFVTAVLSEPPGAGCGVLRATIAAAGDVEMSDDDPLDNPQAAAAAFPLSSMAEADADVVESTATVAVADAPTDTVAGYDVTAAFTIEHCDGVRVDSLLSDVPIDVVDTSGAVVDTVTLPDTADTDDRFAVTWTLPADAADGYRFRVPAGSVEVAGADASYVSAPAADVSTATFSALDNPYPRALADDTDTGSAPAGSDVDLRVVVTDENGVPVAGDVVAFSITDTLEPPGALSAPTATTDGDGVATVTLTLSETAGVNEVRASLDDLFVDIEISGYSTDVDVEQSSLTADPALAIADGVELVEIRLVARDSNGNPVPGVPVTFTTTLGTLASTEGTTSADGTVATTLVSDTEGVAQVGATVGVVELPPIDVEFLPAPDTGLTTAPWPNPVAVGGEVHVPFALAGESGVSIAVYGADGARVATVLEERLDRGYHERVWVADVPAGVYQLRWTAGDAVVDTPIVVDSGRGCATAPGASFGWLAIVAVLARRRRAAAALLVAAPASAASLPDHQLPVDARAEALGRADVAVEDPLVLGSNPAALEAIVAPAVSLGYATRFLGLNPMSIGVAAPIGDLSIGAAARHARLSVDGTGDDGDALGPVPATSSAVGLSAAYTPSPALSVGATARTGLLGVDGRVSAWPIADAGVIWRPNVPGAQIGAAVVGVGAAPEARAGASIRLDDELLPPSAPDLTLAVQGAYGALGGGGGAGLEVQAARFAAVRGGFGYQRGGVWSALGLGLGLGPVRLDYAATFDQGLRHTVTVGAAMAPTRTRALAALRESRDAARRAESARIAADAAEAARRSTTGQLVEALIARTEARMSEVPDLDAKDRALSVKLLDAARSAMTQGRHDDAWVFALQAQLELEEAIGRRRGREAATATSATTTEPTTTESPTASPVPPEAVGAARAAHARSLARAGLEAYRAGDFASAATHWRRAKELDPSLPSIDDYIANAEAKAKMMKSLGGDRP